MTSPNPPIPIDGTVGFFDSQGTTQPVARASRNTNSCTVSALPEQIYRVLSNLAESRTFLESMQTDEICYPHIPTPPPRFHPVGRPSQSQVTNTNPPIPKEKRCCGDGHDEKGRQAL